MKKIRRPLAERLSLLSEWKESGESLLAFAKGKEIPVSLFLDAAQRAPAPPAMVLRCCSHLNPPLAFKLEFRGFQATFSPPRRSMENS